MNTFIEALEFMLDNASLLLEKTWAHVVLSFTAIAVAAALAVPLGVILGHAHRGSFIAINASNLGRSLPSLAVIAIGLAFLGLGFLNSMVALVVVAFPTLLTNAYVAVDRVDRDAVQAARATGMRGWQVLWHIEMPLAVPLIFAGVRIASLYVIGTATLAALAGGGGLGDIIVNQSTYGLSGVIAASIAVAVLALVVEGLLAVTQLRLTPRALRRNDEMLHAVDVVVEQM